MSDDHGQAETATREMTYDEKVRAHNANQSNIGGARVAGQAPAGSLKPIQGGTIAEFQDRLDNCARLLRDLIEIQLHTGDRIIGLRRPSEVADLTDKPCDSHLAGMDWEIQRIELLCQEARVSFEPFIGL